MTDTATDHTTDDVTTGRLHHVWCPAHHAYVIAPHDCKADA